ncbi:MAG TPA: discoidin domain-containing protein [Thermoanaerobaculia bacterium]|nr:discoidin domain-containing protein [Thermoanaerobaculia bacterium]
MDSRLSLVRHTTLALLAILLIGAVPSSERVLDRFDSSDGWRPVVSDGVELKITSEVSSPAGGRAMRLDFDFHGGAGYAIARKEIALELPENYELSFLVRGDAPVNNLEFKLVDESGDNVWWLNRRNFRFSSDWVKLRTKKRQIEFAWGPAGGGEIRKLGALEIVVAAGSGGRGTIWIDELTLRPLAPPRPYTGKPTVRASSSTAKSPASKAVDGIAGTSWRSDSEVNQILEIDFGSARELGAMTIDWDRDDYASRYEVFTSDDAVKWESVWRAEEGNGGRDWLFLPETETRHVRLKLEKSARQKGYAIREVRAEPLDTGASRNAFFRKVASDSVSNRPISRGKVVGSVNGRYPRYLSNIQSYWTVIGAAGDDSEALLNEEGMLEVDQGSFSIEPFLFAESGGKKRLVDWSQVEKTQSLEKGYLPIPTVEWKTSAPSLRLKVTAFAQGPSGSSILFARYRIENPTGTRQKTNLFLAIRPFQVNSPEQFLNVQGGVAEIREIDYRDGRVLINGEKSIIPLSAPYGFGAATFVNGDITEFLVRGELPERASVKDPFGAASAALSYRFDVPAGESRDIVLAIPFHETWSELPENLTQAESRTFSEKRLALCAKPDGEGACSSSVATEWEERLDAFSITLPPPADRLIRLLRSNLAYILINKDGPKIQPGSRSYTRSWIRDGSLTSAALLRLGRADEVRPFLEWYARFQYPNGKIPCCVDVRGADATPEHDSHGQFLYLVMEYYRFTHDRELLRTMWPSIARTVSYIDSLRAERKTAAYRNKPIVGSVAERREPGPFYGLVPESISHEGYSAKAMHSYWDDFFALKGLKDAVDAADVLGETEAAARFRVSRDELRADIASSLRQTMAHHRIDYLPGSVELGDFDATSTTTALSPGDELDHLSRQAVERTFDEYYKRFVARRDGKIKWDAYTPYEWRVVGSLIRLGQRERAHELVDYFLRDSRPSGWNHWAEVVGRDATKPIFIGDMPHTWVGSDFIRSVLDMFAYERGEDQSLVVGAGIRDEWLDSGVAVERLRTYYGPLSVSMKREGGMIVVRIGGDLRVPEGGIVIRSPRAGLRVARINGAEGAVRNDEVVVRNVPAEVTLRY